ncbi:MATE family efflux transporter [Vagococcus vulneris]|uniref:MATE family efflux transporter n=1 Tax=Vagococcus vulneris TaxID=1977869 RepID=A0A430A1U9_9ENTE|nr:MATE family efflux transporter [Vagococcus vulneris]RSU00439.1 MATE family efflux transporter [Vagococcus vulneris]
MFYKAKHFFTNHTISDKELIFLSWPIFVELFLRVFIGNVNVWMISQYSEPAVAAVGSANQLLNLSVFIYGFITVGSQIIIAQLIGAKKHHQIDRVITTALMGSLILGLLISAVFMLFPEQLLHVMNLPLQIIALGVNYLRIYGASLFISSIIATIIAALRSHGQTKAALIIPTIAICFALIGNYAALYGPFGLPHLGVEGLAISAVVSNFIALIFAFIILYKVIGFNILKIKIKNLSLDMLKRILTLGLPSSGENLSYTASQVVVTMIVASLGQNMLIAKSYVTAITQFVYLIAASLSQGNQIMIGRNVGAKEFDRAFMRGKRTIVIAILCSGIISLVTWLAIEPIMTVFTTNDEIIQIAKIIFLIDIFLESGRAVNMVMVGSLNAAGDVKFPLFCSLLVLWVISLPFSYALAIPVGLGLVGVWLAYTIDEGLRAVFMIRRWNSGIWRTKSDI